MPGVFFIISTIILQVISLPVKRILIIFTIFLVSSVVFIRFASYMDKDLEKYFSSATSARKVRPRPQGLKPSSLNPTAVIDASSEDEWAYFDFSSGTVVQIDNPSSLEWDMAFRRNKIIFNGGKTNPQGQVAVVNLGKRDINDILTAPEEGYVADTTGWGGNMNKAIGKWYNYDTRSSILASKGDVYIIRTTDNGYAKMKILGYYCKGRAACYTIEYLYDEEGRFN